MLFSGDEKYGTYIISPLYEFFFYYIKYEFDIIFLGIQILSKTRRTYLYVYTKNGNENCKMKFKIDVNYKKFFIRVLLLFSCGYKFPFLIVVMSLV